MLTAIADDDHAVGVDDDRLFEAELMQRLCDGIDSCIIRPRILVVRKNCRQRPQFDLRGDSLRHAVSDDNGQELRDDVARRGPLNSNK